MDSKALGKIGIAALMAVVATAGSQYIASDHVNVSAVLAAAIAAIFAYVKQSPLGQ